MHVDFVEESYWKRCAAKRFATECAVVALRKAKLRTAKNQRSELEDKERAVVLEAELLEN